MQLVKKIVVVVGLISFYAQADQVIEIDRSGAENHGVPIVIGLSDGNNQDLRAISSVIQRDFTWSSQCAVTVKELLVPKAVRELRDLFEQGYTFAVFLTPVPHGVEWRLYDVLQMSMLKGKRSEHKSGHLIAHELWRELLGSDSPFLTKLAYIKKNGSHAYRRWQLCTSDIDGSHESVILNSKKVLVAPTWGKSVERPTLLFSEFTVQNVRLLGTDLLGHKWSVIDKDGTLVGVSFSPYTDDIVYCRSGQIWLYGFDKAVSKGVHRMIVHGEDVCACPSLCENGDIIYGSRGKIRKYCSSTSKSSDITTEGYCVAPAYCKQMIVYSKRVHDCMQLYLYDMVRNKHVQVTFGAGDKIDACWSPCGNFIAYCHEQGKSSRIAVFVCATRESSFVTPATEQCSYPTWSPVFDKNGNID
jgi:hypothetical protein